MNLALGILRHGRGRSEAVALVDREGSLTFGQLSDAALRTASMLSSKGVTRGDRVAVCLNDDAQQVIAILAVWCLGAVVLQINRRSRPVEIARILETFPPRLAMVRPDIAGAFSGNVVTLDDSWRASVAAAGRRGDIDGDDDAPCAYLASSGTTGLPRFTIATHRQYHFHLACHLELLPANDHRYFSGLSLYYAAGRIACFAHLLRGDTVILGPTLFSPAEFVELIRRHEATIAFIVPSAIRELLAAFAAPGLALPGLQMLLTSGSPVRLEEKQAIASQLTPHFFDIYGSAPIGYISSSRPEDLAARPESVGRIFPTVDVEIVDEAGSIVGPNMAERLRCRGEGLTSPPPGSTEDFRDGWYYPGEIAAMDKEGYLFLRGRSSELIFRGGAKISPSELEDALQQHSDVVEAVVVARSRTNNEQEAIAFVVASRPVSPGVLMAHCRTRLSSFKVPSEIHVIARFPRTATGKIDKQALIAGHLKQSRQDPP